MQSANKKQTKKPTPPSTQSCTSKTPEQFPEEFPFWARLKISKNRTTLVIDEEMVVDKVKKKQVPGFVHREGTSVYHKGFEEINPNPDTENPEPMYLKSPRKLPKALFKPHNKDLTMPQKLKERYAKNNEK